MSEHFQKIACRYVSYRCFLASTRKVELKHLLFNSNWFLVHPFSHQTKAPSVLTPLEVPLQCIAIILVFISSSKRRRYIQTNGSTRQCIQLINTNFNDKFEEQTAPKNLMQTLDPSSHRASPQKQMRSF